MIEKGDNAMFLEGQLEDGRVVLDTPTDLPNGTRVRVETVAAHTPPPSPASLERKPIPGLEELKAKLARDRENPPPPGPTLAERLAPFIGCLVDLPHDASTNHDYYIRHGLPKLTKDES